MPLRSETIRAHERLQFAAPICDDASLPKLKGEVSDLLRETKDLLRETKQDASGPDEIASAVVDEVARKYFQHILRQQARSVRRRAGV
jgi:hypothetical protein